MTQLEIRVFGDPVLRQRAQRVTVFDEKLATLADGMMAAMLDAPGVGLAAPQVGVLKRLFTWQITDVEWDDDGRVVPGSEATRGGAIVNPVVTDTDDEHVQVDDEGCLSFPGLFYEVSRPLRVQVDWQDLQGEQRRTQLEGFDARVWLHEMDHLDGILFIDHLAAHDRREAMKLMRLYREQQGLDAGDVPRGFRLLRS